MGKTLFEKLAKADTGLLSENNRRYAEFLNNAEVINIQNVADYFYVSNDKEYWLYTDFPNIAPPFENFFMEANLPSVINSEGKSIKNNIIGKYGLLFSSEDVQGIQGQRWVTNVIFFTDIDEIRRYPLYALLALDENGKMLCDERGIIAPKWAFENDQDKKVMDELRVFLSSLLDSALLAISFMHCKNVTLEEHRPGVPGKRNRHGPHITFKTLNIKPMKKILSEEGNSESTGLKRALHICRGHFKNFGGKGLFGKYTGTYWWDSQVRGKAENGLVIKDYKVTPPD
jgi:hypothetical protein